jgi:hypothetical protein
MLPIPIEIVNKILSYVSDINNSLILMQYNLFTNEEYFKIKFNSDLLLNIKSTLLMKRFYPIISSYGDISNKDNRELYKYGKLHYEEELRQINIDNLKY